MIALRPFVNATIIRNTLRCSRNFYPIAASHHLLPTARSQENHNTNFSSAAVIEDNNSKGIFSKILGKFGNSKAKLRVASLLLYENVADKIVYYDFFEEFGLPDTFNSWFLVTELHCWLILTRVMHEGSESGEDGRFLRNCLVESLWSDVQIRAKKLSMDNPSAARKQVAIIAEQFQAALIIYDEGLMSDDKTLASALWRRFFAMECDDYSKIEKLVSYVRQTAAQLDSMTREELVSKPQITWKSIRD